MHTFCATIEDAGGGGAFVSVPFDVERAFGKKRVPVQATFDGVPYRGTLVRMGGDCHMLPMLKAIREQVGKQPGDEVEVTVREDDEPRVVVVPDDLRAAIEADPQARGAFDKLSYTHRKEFVRWVEEARRAPTRTNRIARTVEMLRAGLKPS